MNSSRKHARAAARRPEMLTYPRRGGAALFPGLAAVAVGILLTALSPCVSAQQASAGRQRPARVVGEAAAKSEAASDAGDGTTATTRAVGLAGGPDAPMRIHLAGTADSPVVVATIGDFDADLGEDGKFFVRREFIEHFVTNVLELGGPARGAAVIAFSSQAEGNERECTFKIGDVSGRLSVLVTPRRVFVMCSFGEDEKDTRNLASLGGGVRGPLAPPARRAG